ncbi:MAG: trehalase, partial [Bacteroidota bacterium]
MDNSFFFCLIVFLFLNSCRDVGEQESSTLNQFSFSENVLDYNGVPNFPRDRDMLMFSDQGAWFAYGIPDTVDYHGGFSGPFLMTQENGVWLSPALQRLKFNLNGPGEASTSLTNALISQKSYASHLEQVYVGSVLNVKQELTYLSAHTALQRTEVTNRTDKSISLDAQYSGLLFDVGVQAEAKGGQIALISEKSDAVGYLLFLDP